MNLINEKLHFHNYSLYFFSIDNSYPKNFTIFSDSRNIEFFPIDIDTQINNDFYNKYKKIINEILKDIRNIKYKSSKITIISKYNITKFYGKNISEMSEKEKEEDYFIYTFTKYQFIPGKEYIYVFDVELGEYIKYGDRILYAKIDYNSLNGEPAPSSPTISSSLKFYNAINYFKVKKEEFCRIRLMEALELFLRGNNQSLNKLNDIVKEINDDFCGKDFSNKYLGN